MVTRGEWGRDKVRFGTDMYTQLYIKYVASQNLLHSAGTSMQYSVMVYMRKESKKKKKKRVEIYLSIYLSIYLIHFAIHLKITQHCNQLYSNHYFLIQKEK